MVPAAISAKVGVVRQGGRRGIGIVVRQSRHCHEGSGARWPRVTETPARNAATSHATVAEAKATQAAQTAPRGLETLDGRKDGSREIEARCGAAPPLSCSPFGGGTALLVVGVVIIGKIGVGARRRAGDRAAE